MSRDLFLLKNLLSPDGNEVRYHHFFKIYGLCPSKEIVQNTLRCTLSLNSCSFCVVLVIFFTTDCYLLVCPHGCHLLVEWLEDLLEGWSHSQRKTHTIACAAVKEVVDTCI